MLMMSVNTDYSISSISCLGVNQQIVSCLPGIKRSTGVNLNVEFWRRLERITSTPPGVKTSRGVYNVQDVQSWKDDSYSNNCIMYQNMYV